MKQIITFFLILITSISFAQNGTYITNRDSEIKWTGEKITGDSHTGIINIIKGQLFVKDGAIKKGSFAIDMNSIVCTDIKNEKKNGYLVSHLKNDDFFSVDDFPISVLEITSSERKKKGIITYYGILTIKGIAQEISFDGQTSINDESFESTAKITIDRTLWDIKYKLPIGDKGIKKEIEFEVNISAGKLK